MSRRSGEIGTKNCLLSTLSGGNELKTLCKNDLFLFLALSHWSCVVLFSHSIVCETFPVPTEGEEIVTVHVESQPVNEATYNIKGLSSSHYMFQFKVIILSILYIQGELMSM